MLPLSSTVSWSMRRSSCLLLMPLSVTSSLRLSLTLVARQRNFAANFCDILSLYRVSLDGDYISVSASLVSSAMVVNIVIEVSFVTVPGFFLNTWKAARGKSYLR